MVGIIFSLPPIYLLLEWLILMVLENFHIPSIIFVFYFYQVRNYSSIPSFFFFLHCLFFFPSLIQDFSRPKSMSKCHCQYLLKLLAITKIVAESTLLSSLTNNGLEAEIDLHFASDLIAETHLKKKHCFSSFGLCEWQKKHQLLNATLASSGTWHNGPYSTISTPP